VADTLTSLVSLMKSITNTQSNSSGHQHDTRTTHNFFTFAEVNMEFGFIFIVKFKSEKVKSPLPIAMGS
jgi:hypothetical protein